MERVITRSYLGLELSLTLAVTPAPSVEVLSRDAAGERVDTVLERAAQRCAEYLAVATQDELRDELTKILTDRKLPVVRVEIGVLGPHLEARATLADASHPLVIRGDLEAATDAQIADAADLVDLFVAAHAAKE